MLELEQAPGGNRSVPCLDCRLRVVGMHRLRPAEAFILGRRLAREGRPAGLFALHLADCIVCPDDAVNRLDCGPEARFACNERDFGLNFSSHVARRRQQPDRSPILALDGNDRDVPVFGRAFRSRPCCREYDRPTSSDRLNRLFDHRPGCLGP